MKHKKPRRIPRITTQPRVPHWEYRYYDKGDYALIETNTQHRSPLRTSRLIFKAHVPAWMSDAMAMIELAYDKTKSYTEVPGFGCCSRGRTEYTFYAQQKIT